MQIANKVLMIRPAKFYSNPDTATDNSFQRYTEDDLTSLAQQEFDNLVNLLRAAGITVCVIQDTRDTETPDSIFPNNRVSFHSNGVAVVYPMKALNRRTERQLETFSILEEENTFKLRQLIDYSSYEEKNIFLEGTGSMILDRKNKTIYAARSQRTDETLIDKVAENLAYNSVIFDAGVETDDGHQSIYHTNVMLAIAEDFIIIAADVIDPKQRESVLNRLENSGREVIQITIDQMNNFCGNVLQLSDEHGNKIIAMSNTALQGFTPSQTAIIQTTNTIVAAEIPTIEKASGGSVRCMLAEIF